MKQPPSTDGTVWAGTAGWLRSFSGVETGWFTDGTEGRGLLPWIFFFCSDPKSIVQIITLIHPIKGQDTHKYSTIEVDVFDGRLRYKLTFPGLATLEAWRRELKIEN